MEAKPDEIHQLPLSPKRLARFNRCIDKNGPLPEQQNPTYRNLGQCHTWLGPKTKVGYPRFWIGEKLYMAHRIIWIMKHGPIPPKMIILHRCDNPSCVNINHLAVGTHQDNANDRDRKKRRWRLRRGEQQKQSKLTESQVRDIRKWHTEKIKTMTDMAKQFNVSLALVSKIIKKKAWSHVI